MCVVLCVCVRVDSDSLPKGYDSALPNPVAVFTTDVTEDPLLEVRKGYCKSTLEHDQGAWDEEVGAFAPLLAPMIKIELCSYAYNA